MSVNGLFRKPHVDSAKAEGVCKGIAGTRLAKQKSGQDGDCQPLEGVLGALPCMKGKATEEFYPRVRPQKKTNRINRTEEKYSERKRQVRVQVYSN